MHHPDRGPSEALPRPRPGPAVGPCWPPAFLTGQSDSPLLVQAEANPLIPTARVWEKLRGVGCGLSLLLKSLRRLSLAEHLLCVRHRAKALYSRLVLLINPGQVLPSSPSY